MMSFDDNNIKTRKFQFYLDSLHRDKKRRTTKIIQKSQLKAKKIDNNKSENKLSIQRHAKKQMTIGPLCSTLESTISSSKHQREDENSNLPSESGNKITIKSKKLLQPVDDDMKFLFDIFYKTNFNNQSNNLRKSTQSEFFFRYSKRTVESNYNNYQNNYDFNSIKKYLIKIQKKYNINGNAVLYNNRFQNKRKSLAADLMDSFYLNKLEDLLARYSLVIYLFIKCGKIKEAKDIFLLMIKENMNNINIIDERISSKYLVINRKINIYKDVPKITYGLAKTYSFIIKYSQLFSLTNYRNIFIYKYFKIILLNYNFFIIKGMSRGFSGETRNQLKFWLSYCFHICSYYSIYNYAPLKAPILFNYNILHLYSNIDDNSLTDSERSLLIKSAFNEGLLYYINDQKDEALISLNIAKEKITSYSDDYYANYNFGNKKKNTGNIFKNHVKENIIEINEKKKIRKKSTINPFKLKFIEEGRRNDDKTKTVKILTLKKSEKSFDNSLFNPNDISLISIDSGGKKSTDLKSPKGKYEVLKSNIYKGFKKDKISISDIELLVEYGKDKGLLKEDDPGSKGLDFLFKYKESFSAIKKKITLPKGFRGSHIDFHTNMNIKDFFIPEKFKNPLLRKIELFMALIELDKKNYESSYEHVLKVLYILFLLKLSNNNYNIEFYNKQIIEINDYFRLIEDSYEKELKNKQNLEKSSSKSILTANDRKSLSNFNNPLNNSLNLNSNSFIIFENKEVENDFYQRYMNYFNNNNDINQNNFFLNNNSEKKDSKIVKEFEKFFIFLNNLSLYQIKLLNETQPDSDKRNHLPIMFSNQFKDCLTKIQRLELDNMQTMTLSRFMILKDPNKWIMPINLNFLLINRNNNPQLNKRKSLHLSLNRFDFIDETFMKTKEYQNYLSIINSEKCAKDIKEFLIKNKNFVFKIIKESNDKEINNMIEYPYIIIAPIKQYKKKIKKFKKRFASSDKYPKRPKTLTHGLARKKLIKGNYLFKNEIRHFTDKELKRNKSVIDECCQLKNNPSINIKDNNIKFNNDDESFEEYSLSINKGISSFSEDIDDCI